ncbi:DUF1799 domain-containing protein [Oleomonas cavernae]|uniref:DUF1799 domain-containing protein n=1 Tax=Oleomonas cavernae TaxID=2320859 RepID=UPI0023687643|nr:DUF1799 domain-containing protein [Oleomonas cavernae]
MSDAARTWATGGGSTTKAREALEEELAGFGIVGPGADQLRARFATETEIELWPENLAAFAFFQSVATQWLHAGMGGSIVGLNYAAVAVVANAQGLTLDGNVMADLQAMEIEALAVFRGREERERQQARSRRG